MKRFEAVCLRAVSILSCLGVRRSPPGCMTVACLGEVGFPLGWNVKELVVSIIPVLVSMQVLKEQGRWPGDGGVYGGYPVSRAEARRRYESVRARHEEASYLRAAKEDYSDREARVLAVLAGVTALILGVGTFALCACSRHWEIVVMPCVLVAAGVAVLYAAWRMGRS